MSGALKQARNRWRLAIVAYKVARRQFLAMQIDWEAMEKARKELRIARLEYQLISLQINSTYGKFRN